MTKYRDGLGRPIPDALFENDSPNKGALDYQKREPPGATDRLVTELKKAAPAPRQRPK